MKLLLHICCAPCLIYPLKQLNLRGIEAEGVFYNPNIHPLLEYENRRGALEKFSREAGIGIFYPGYNPQEFFRAVSLSFPEGARAKEGEGNSKEKTLRRCFLCWRMRLERTAFIAKERGFDSFSSTLLVSPYQNHEILRGIGGEVGRQTGIDFYYDDFRPGFRQAYNKARSSGIYCQKYCGCVYSAPSASGSRLSLEQSPAVK